MNRFGTWICGLCLATQVLASIRVFAFQEIVVRSANHRHLAIASTLSSAKNDYSIPSMSQERRFFLSYLAVVPVLPFLVEPATASGGATAGGAYLLSAKQRYNERVKASVRGLLSIGDALKNGDSKPAKLYFESEEEGTWKDMTAAGYLLSNAFRRNSTAAPDSLPSVKVMFMQLFFDDFSCAVCASNLHHHSNSIFLVVEIQGFCS
jgi:hypothetical protein